MDPKKLRYAKTHEWASLEGNVCTVGITQFAVDQLTDVVYIELPEVGDHTFQGEGFGEIESVKAVSDLYAPVNGEVIEINDKLLGPDAKGNDNSNDRVKRISANMELLARVEERAEILRKQLLELIEKETAYKSRMAQIDEDIRPENIERALSGIGTTRTVELRETRRRVLENERKGLESLLNQTTSSRIRLEEDVRQADSLVTKLRQRLMPLIEREIEKINPN